MKLKKLDIAYYEWLISQVDIPNNKTYRELFERMHNVEYIPVVIMDENRVADCYDLRKEFSRSKYQTIVPPWISLLEIFIIVSRLAGQTSLRDRNPQRWAWRILKNARLTSAHDPFSEERANRVDDILYSLLWRTYEADGSGGFFPLKKPKEDQRKVELWYQLNAYIIEREL